MDKGRSLVVDKGIVRSDPCRFGVCRAVASDICSLWPNEAYEVMHIACFVIQDLEKKGRDDLLDFSEVGLGRLPGDRIKVLEGMSEFRHDLLGRHCG